MVVDNEVDNPDNPDDGWDSRHREEKSSSETRPEYEDDEAALRDAEGGGAVDEDVMELIATQSQPVARPADEPIQVDDDEEMREVAEDEEPIQPLTEAPPVFRPVHFDLEEKLGKSVQRRMRKNHEPVLEELPKWSLLAKILKEIEDTMARIQTSHSGTLHGSRN